MAIFNTSQVTTEGGGGGSVSIIGASTLQVTNVVCTLAATEYSFTLPTATKKLKIRARGYSRIQLTDISGNTATNFFTIWPGECYEDEILTSAIVLYFEVSKANEIIEIITWT